MELYKNEKEYRQAKLDETMAVIIKLQTINISLEDEVKILEGELFMSNTMLKTFTNGT